MTSSSSKTSALFSSENEKDEYEDFSEGFIDKVRAIHEYFDKDKDGCLNMEELRHLQICTSGGEMNSDMYLMVCKALDCDPNKGINLDALRLTYAAEGTNVDDDYKKVFGDGKGKTKSRQSNDDSEEIIYEVGAGGVDIS